MTNKELCNLYLTRINTQLGGDVFHISGAYGGYKLEHGETYADVLHTGFTSWKVLAQVMQVFYIGLTFKGRKK